MHSLILKKIGFGTNYRGTSLTTVYGERVKEYCNLDTVENAGLFRKGFSTDLDVASKWVQHIHILTKRKIWMRK